MITTSASFKKFIFRLIGLLTLIAIAIFVGARVFTALEGWRYEKKEKEKKEKKTKQSKTKIVKKLTYNNIFSYGDSVYYCFITLLTIGMTPSASSFLLLLAITLAII